jgi:MFS family permease
MRWIIASGLLHNFIMYALTFFLPSFLVRHHQATLQKAGLVSALVVGTVGAVGMLVGGWLGDLVREMRPDGRMLLAGVAVLAAAPAGLAALLLPQGALLPFMVLQGIAAFLMYTYYATVYATIQDIIEPGLRGRAMAVYFFAMYVLGASFGPVATGWLSDTLARHAAAVSGFTGMSASAIPERFRAVGLHRAMFVIPALGTVLAAVLFGGAATVRRDIRIMQEWLDKEQRAGSSLAAKR